MLSETYLGSIERLSDENGISILQEDKTSYTALYNNGFSKIKVNTVNYFALPGIEKYSYPNISDRRLLYYLYKYTKFFFKIDSKFVKSKSRKQKYVDIRHIITVITYEFIYHKLNSKYKAVERTAKILN